MFLSLFTFLAFTYLAEANLGIDPNSTTNYHTRQAGRCNTDLSPININTKRCKQKNFNRDFRWYNHSGSLQMLNTGVTVQVPYMRTDERPFITGGPLGLKEYNHLNTHFHWGATDTKGSEHSINGVFGPLETHFVYVNRKYSTLEKGLEHNDGVAVVVVMYKLSTSDNPDLSGILDGVNSVQLTAGDSTTLETDSLDFAVRKVFSRKHFYSYLGSLTGGQPVPPCTKSVKILVMKKLVPISSAQVNAFRGVKDVNGISILSNRMEIQPLNGRRVICSGCL
ncbi:carbonic anhydrase 2-like [Neocloeon triangulifer]|uniref:carbonic anhydrase 2-like n=1 Tax=Neocloeon triangulifer TaxID=2078957 RepID=UPI00286EC538|nr:carbonic anhydrase 2-like [Neocloeon triangulifer]